MWLQPFQFLIRKNIGLSVGAALLLSSSAALALPSDPQPNSSSNKPVVVETPTPTATQTPSPTPNSSTPPISSNVSRFSCQLMNGQYTVVYHPKSQPSQAFPWAVPQQLGGGWTPELRCNEISRRLEAYRPDGLLEMRTAVENTYSTVCVTTQKNSQCRIVLTVPPGQDPTVTRDRVFQNITIADSGKQTEGVNTFVGGSSGNTTVEQLYNLGHAVLAGRNQRTATSNGIDLRPFLDQADGGTGNMLRGGVSDGTSPRLSPNNF